MKGDIYAINCASCLTPQFVYGGDLKHYQINETDHLYKTHCPCCKQIMLVPALTSFMNLVHRAPRPPFVPYVPKSPAAAIPEAGPASDEPKSLWEQAQQQGKESAARFINALNIKAFKSVDEDKDDENKEKSYIQYLDTNSLYGWTNIFDDEDYIDLVNPDELDRILESYDLLEQEAYEANDVNNEEPFLRNDGTD